MKKEKKKVINLTSQNNVMEFLIRERIPFEISFTNRTAAIDLINENKKYLISDSNLKFKELGFIRQVKSCAEKCGKPFVDVRGTDINYFKWGDCPTGIYKDFYEIDINGAYWNVAFKKGYINEEIYNKGLEVDKMTRLISLGSIATVKNVYYFDGINDRLKLIEQKKNELTRSYFFNISKEIDNLMLECFELLGFENVLFYWVDAIFVSGFVVDEVVRFFKSKGFDVKSKKMQTIDVRSGGLHGDKKVLVTEMKKDEKGISRINQRSFLIPPRKKELQEKYFSDMIIKTLSKLK